MDPTIFTRSTPSESDDKGPAFLTLTIVLFSISITTTILRVWVRKARYTLGWDDYTIALTALLTTARTGIQIDSVRRGNGKHKVFLSTRDYQYVNMETWYTQVLLFITITLLKTSICMLILRIKKDKKLKYCLYGIITGLVLTNGLVFIVLLAECSPVKRYWNPDAGGHCWDAKVRIYSIYLQAAYSILTDLICSLLPILVIWKVKIPLKDKLYVCGLMSLGLIATVCAAIRASSLGLSVSDLSYEYCIAAIWANTELHLGIIAANLALARSIFLYFFHGAKNLSSASRSRSGTGAYGNRSRSRGGNGYFMHEDVNMSTTCRRASDSNSHDSKVPFRSDTIAMGTDLYVMEDLALEDGDAERGLGLGHSPGVNVRHPEMVYKS